MIFRYLCVNAGFSEKGSVNIFVPSDTIYGELYLSRPSLGLAIAVRLREMSTLERVLAVA